MPAMKTLFRGLAAALFAFLSAGPALAESVACHVTYGGETRSLAAEPVVTPYGVANKAFGSYLRVRLVFQREPADQAAIKIYTFTDRDEGMTPIHQATYPYPPPPPGRYGFTGLHFVYEPVRDGELQYWCELVKAPPVPTPAAEGKQ